jgi:hypothetical protein
VQKITNPSGNGRSFVVRSSPKQFEITLAYILSTGSLVVTCHDGVNWTNWTVAVGGTGTTRRYDVAYESQSGDVMVLYSTNASGSNELAYRVKSGSSDCTAANWSAPVTISTARTTGTVQWVKMSADPRTNSNRIAAAWADSSGDLSSLIWTGSAWQNEPSNLTEGSLETVASVQDTDTFDIEYSSSAGTVMLVWSNSTGAHGVNSVKYRTCTNGTDSCTWNAITAMPTFSDDGLNLSLAAHPTSDEMVFASIGKGGYLQAGYWNGTTWTNTANVDTTTTIPTLGTKLVSAGWLTAGGTKRSIIAYEDSGANNVGWYVGNNGVFTQQTDFTPTPVFANTQGWYDIQTDPKNLDRMMLTVADGNSDLFAKQLLMTSTPTFQWTNADGGTALVTTLSQFINAPFSYTYLRYSP